MIRLIVEKHNIRESYGVPCEGIFWLINNDLIVYTDPVNRYSTQNIFDHKRVWESIKEKYGNVVFNYYPRGRVMVNPVTDNTGTLTGYKAYIYLDNCINTEEVLNELRYEFRLTSENCEVVYHGSDGGITSNHYTCHNCK